MSTIIGVHTAFPEYHYQQKEMMDFLKTVWPAHAEVLERLNSTSGVSERNTVVPMTHFKSLGGFEHRNKIYIESIVPLLVRAVTGLQAKIDFDWKDLAVITSTTITGVAVPSLEARLMNILPIPIEVVRNPLFGIGCLGGVAGLNRTHDLLKARPDKLALLIAAEACSLTFQFDDVTMANMVASSLFADGAAAVLLAGPEHPLAQKGRLKLIDSMTRFYHDTERIMGWDIVDSGFKVILSGNVPSIVDQHLNHDAKAFLKKHHLNLQDINSVLSHPGGPKVLKSVASALEKDDSFLRHSRESLNEHGNMSSVSVLNVIERHLKDPELKPGHALALALGPAFNAEMTLIQVRGQ